MVNENTGHGNFSFGPNAFKAVIAFHDLAVYPHPCD